MATAITWVTSVQVQGAAGAAPASPTDQEYLQLCTDAANEWAFRRRQQAGYVDSQTVSPGPDVTLGTIAYALARYRARGAADGFASFEDYDTGTAPPGGGFTEIKQLLGIPRPAAG